MKTWALAAICVCFWAAVAAGDIGATAGAGGVKQPTEDLRFSLHVGMAEACGSLKPSTGAALAQCIREDLGRPPVVGRPPVKFAGCRATVAGPFLTFGLAVSVPPEAANATKAALLGADNAAQLCLLLPGSCVFVARRNIHITAAVVEAVAPPEKLSSSIPLGWSGFDGSKKVLLPVQLGSAQQPMSAVLDTGSTVPWVSGYAWRSSSTFANTTEPGVIVYGGASDVTGFFSTDQARLGGAARLRSFEFLLRDGDNGTGSPNATAGGLLGFAPGGSPLPGQQPAAGVVYTWRQISAAMGFSHSPRNRFGLWLSNDQARLRGKSAFAGELDLGDLNARRFTGEPVWAPVQPANSSVRTNAVNGQVTWWQFTANRIAIVWGDGSTSTICEMCNTIADSGWPEIVITPSDASALAIGSLDGTAPGHAGQCAHQLLIDLGAAGELRMNLTADGAPPVAGCATNYPASGDERVFSGFRVDGLAPGVNNWFILGLPFLRQFYLVGDFDQLRVGFYKSVQA